MILHWESFEQEVMQYVRMVIEAITETVLPPVFEMQNEVIETEVPALQMFISRNYMRRYSRYF